MKKLSLFFVVPLLSAFLSIQTVYAADVTVLGFSTEVADIIYEQKGDTLIYIDPLVSDDMTESVLEYYELIPENILGRFEEYGVKIYVSGSARFIDSSEDTSVKALSSTALVSYYRLSKKITEIHTSPYTVISTIALDYYDCVVHEAGHLLDHIAMLENGRYMSSQYYYSSSDEWGELYDEYRYSYAAIDELSYANVLLSESEGFCEAFRLAVLKPDELLQRAPEIYEYIMNVIEEFGGTE